jgi:glycosyltransferase involved in cell wall biosynthesis
MNKIIELNLVNSIPLVSVAIATYNGEKFLRQQLDSIYSQTYKNIEVVVTDDCSTDSTVEILEQYKQEQGLRYLVNEKNIGFVRNFEKAISLCKGEYIALSDQDDVWKPEKIEILLHEIGDCTLIYSPATEYIHKDGFIAKVPDIDFYVNFCTRFGNGKPTKRLIATNWVVSHQILFKRELSEFALPIPNGQYYHDAWLAIVASKLNGLKFLSRGLMYYRQHEESFTYQTFQHSRPKLLKALHYFINRESRIKATEQEIYRLTNILHFSLLDLSDKVFIQELIYSCKCRLELGIHLRSFYIAVKYINLFSSQRSKLFKFMFLATALIGQI